jgi:hypothetical protein
MGEQGTANQALTWFFVQKLPGTPGELTDYARQVEDIKVDTGIGLGSLIEVIGQLDAGDRVVVRGAERLQAGQAVVVTNPESQML